MRQPGVTLSHGRRGPALPFAASLRSDYHKQIVHRFWEDNPNMGPDNFRTNVSRFAQLVLAVTFTVLLAISASAQTMPERQSKAAKPIPTAQPPDTTTSDSDAAESSKP